MRAKTASIVHEQARAAGREVARELLDEFDGQAPEFVLMFASAEHDLREVVDGLSTVLPDEVRLIGCSSVAEIGREGALEGSITLMGVEFGEVEWELFRVDSVAGESVDAGVRLGELIRPFAPKLVIVLPDGLVANSMKFVNGMQQVLGHDCPIVGGLASEGLKFEHTYQIFDREVFEGGAVALALRGPVTVATAAGSGFQPVGLTRTCTEVEDDKLIRTLDGEPALELYKQFLGEDVAQRPFIGLEFPLALISTAGADYMASDERTQVIRAVRQLDEERGVIVCAGDVYPGATLRMTRATKDDLIAAATHAVEQANARLPSPALCLMFNCVGRKIVLGGRYHEEIESAFSVLDEAIPRIGFYTYGEIAPIDGTNMYHDETFTMVFVGAR